ncbi:MAG: NAD(P)H-dependent oxidoreductase [Deltaproteobacteria bacterium]|nr:NAD(P)H-dependent oxidoreductase [Deltaproteobacteria bacterium]
MKSIRIVGIGGSLAVKSSSLEALEEALRAARGAGAEARAFDIRSLALPMYDPGLDAPPAVRELAQAVEEADGLVWSTPLYHGSISGSFKNALDWLETLSGGEKPYLSDKPVGLISTAGGTHGLQAINAMENIVRALRGWTVPLVVPVPQAWKGIDPKSAEQLARLGQEIVRSARAFRGSVLG